MQYYVGPSYTTDSTWIGGAQALMRAKKMIEDGVINAAIIGSCNLCMNPTTSLQFEGLGILNNSTETKSYSADGMFTIYILLFKFIVVLLNL